MGRGAGARLPPALPSPGLHVHDVQGVFQEAGLELIVLRAAGCQ